MVNTIAIRPRALQKPRSPHDLQPYRRADKADVNIPTTLMIVFCLAMMISLPTQAAERWFLMSRHGECAKVDALRRKIPDLGEINDPHAFVALMRKNGHNATLRQTPVTIGSAYEVSVPEKELFLIFVTPEVCGNSSPTPHPFR